jgi:ankyrin repeat protein
MQHLPAEVVFFIGQYLEIQHYSNLRRTCHFFHQLSPIPCLHSGAYQLSIKTFSKTSHDLLQSKFHLNLFQDSSLVRNYEFLEKYELWREGNRLLCHCLLGRKLLVLGFGSVLQCACHSNNPKLLRELLNQGQFEVESIMAGVETCCSLGLRSTHFHYLSHALKEEKSGPYLLQIVCKYGQRDYLDILLGDVRIDPACNDQFAFITAVENNFGELVSLFLNDGRVDPMFDDCGCLRAAVSSNADQSLRALLQDNRINPSYDEEEALYQTVINNRINLIEVLLLDGRPNPGNYGLISYAVEKGNILVIQLLLNDNRVDPSVFNNYAIRFACETGSVEITRLLLNHPKVDPSVNNNDCLKKAVKKQYVEVVRLLLKHPKVDPNSGNGAPLAFACQKGDRAMVEALLEHPATDASQNKCYAIVMLENNRHTDLMHILLGHSSLQVGMSRRSAKMLKGNPEAEEGMPSSNAQSSRVLGECLKNDGSCLKQASIEEIDSTPDSPGSPDPLTYIVPESPRLDILLNDDEENVDPIPISELSDDLFQGDEVNEQEDSVKNVTGYTMIKESEVEMMEKSQNQFWKPHFPFRATRSGKSFA